jgi:hypothetical protein
MQQIEQSEWCKIQSSLDWDQEFSKRDENPLFKSELHILDILPTNMYVPVRMDRSSCHVFCTRSRKYRPSGPVWLPDQYLRMMTCSDKLPGPPPQSFVEFLERITLSYFTFALDLATTYLLVFYWLRILSFDKWTRWVDAMKDKYIRLPLRLKILIEVFSVVPSACLLLYNLLSEYVDFRCRLWEFCFTVVFVILLPWILGCWTSGVLPKIPLSTALGFYRSWSAFIIATQFWCTIHLFGYLLSTYSTRSSCAYERTYMMSDWRNMVWFWDPSIEFDNYQ